MRYNIAETGVTDVEWLKDYEDEEIDCSLGVIMSGAVDEDMMEYLINADTRSDDFALCIELVVDDLWRRIKEERLHRWDFDLGDKAHANQSKISYTVMLPKSWKMQAKRRVLYFIIGAFRKRCHNLVEKLVDEFEGARDFIVFRKTMTEAIERGVFVEDSGNLCHCVSIVDSKKAFAAYQHARQRV